MDLERAHWAMRLQHIARSVLDQISDDRFYDGVILGLAIAVLPLVAWLWWSGQ